MRIVAISDTHRFHEQVTLPEGDMLVHCGDFCGAGTFEEYEEFLDWFESQPHRHKIFVAGNHDMVLEKEPERCRTLVPASVHYLEDSGVECDGVKVWGAPWTPIFFDWSFMLPRGDLIRAKWDLIPTETDLLITHGPPYGNGDLAPPMLSEHPKAVGCVELLKAAQRVRPKIHLFGHIHDGHGVTLSDAVPHTKFGNAAICTERYEPTNPPLVFDL